jgi:hypothetical protein
MTPTHPPQEEPAPPGDPIRMALGALVASCYAGYRRAKKVAEDDRADDPAGSRDGVSSPPAPTKARSPR